MKRILLLAMVTACFAFAQTTTSVDGTSNSFVAAIGDIGNRTNVQFFLTVGYFDTAAPEDYIDITVLRSDASFLIQNVTNKNAPLEVFSAAVLNGIFGKYPQIQSLVVQVIFASQTVNQQSVTSQRTRPTVKPPTDPEPTARTKTSSK